MGWEYGRKRKGGKGIKGIKNGTMGRKQRKTDISKV
jgi:hypothetical protein